MKKLIHFLGMFLSLALVAANGADRPPAEPNREEGATRLQEMFEELELTIDQKAQLAPILEKEARDLQALRDDTSLRRGQKLRRARTIAEAASRQVRALLTPEQERKYDEFRAEMREKLKERAKERRDTDRDQGK